MGIRVISDIHGKTADYLNIVKSANESGLNTLQIGDFGFDYSCLKSVDSVRNKFIGGNHDVYSILCKNPPPHYLGDFGIHRFNDESEFFFVRGAFSIDKAYRREGVSWWPQEELTIKEGLEALKLYRKVKPDIMITHDAPSEIVSDICGRMYVIENRTSQLLQAMFDFHKPRVWYFGHHHLRYKKDINGTIFQCLPELEFIDI